MENRVNAREVFGESELIGMRTWLCDNGKGTELLFRKLGRRTCRGDVLCVDVHRATDSEIRIREALAVGDSLVALGCMPDLNTEVLVDGVDVNSEITGAIGSEITFGVDGQIRIVSFIGKEWRQTSRRIWSVVVSELGERQQRLPVVLLVGTVTTKVLLERLVGALGLAVGLWVIARREMDFHVKELTERPHEGRNKFRTSVAGNVLRDAMFGDDMYEEKVCEALGGDGDVGRNKDALLG